MAALKSVVLVALALATVPAQASPVERWRPYITEAAQRFGVPEAWIERVMRAESGGQTMRGGKPIRSRVGAMGLMQLMPATWAEMRTFYHLGADPNDPHDNILAGAATLRRMADRFGYPGLFAAYNAGPARYAAYLAGRSHLPAETIAYLRNVTGSRAPASMNTVTSPHELLFALRRDLAADPLQTGDQSTENGMFAIRKTLTDVR